MSKSSCCDTGGMGGGHGMHGGRGGHGMHHGHHGSECCCHPGRQFITRAEQLAHLEKYKEQVELELKGVEEHIEMLKAHG